MLLAQPPPSLTDDDRRRFAQALRRLRESRALSLRQMARRMGRAPSARSIFSRWESGESVPHLDKLWHYLRAMGATFTDLDRELEEVPPVRSLLETLREDMNRLHSKR